MIKRETFFAPHTTGIPFDVNREVEIIKQFFDIGNLIEILSDTKFGYVVEATRLIEMK